MLGWTFLPERMGATGPLSPDIFFHILSDKAEQSDPEYFPRHPAVTLATAQDHGGPERKGPTGGIYPDFRGMWDHRVHHDVSSFHSIFLPDACAVSADLMVH
jgi:hypothetical protein